MAQENADSDLMPLVAVGAAFVAIGTALASAQLLLGLLILVDAVTLLVFAVVRMVQRQQRQPERHTFDRSGLWVRAVVIGQLPRPRPVRA